MAFPGYIQVGVLGHDCHYCKSAVSEKWDCVPRRRQNAPITSGHRFAVCRTCWWRVYKAERMGPCLSSSDKIALCQSPRSVKQFSMPSYKPVYNANDSVIGYESDYHPIAVSVETMERAMREVPRLSAIKEVAVLSDELDKSEFHGEFRVALLHYILGASGK